MWRSLWRFVGAFVGVVLAVVGLAASIISIGQFLSLLPQRIVFTLPALSFPDNPLLWVGLLAAAALAMVVGVLLWRRSTAPVELSRSGQRTVIAGSDYKP
jgi:hypothetical protein